jgi:hypothetical protein
MFILFFKKLNSILKDIDKICFNITDKNDYRIMKSLMKFNELKCYIKNKLLFWARNCKREKNEENGETCQPHAPRSISARRGGVLDSNNL